MLAESERFLIDLLQAPGPPGGEAAAAGVWRTYTSQFATTYDDQLGSCYAGTGTEGTSVVVLGHIDEIGLVITEIDDAGFLWFAALGTWLPSTLLGQRTQVLAHDGPVTGVVGSVPPHLIPDRERGREMAIDRLWIDVGTAADAARVTVGDLAVVVADPIQVGAGRIASRAVDNRAGAFVAAEVVRLCAAKSVPVRLTGVACVGEEIGSSGARHAMVRLKPDTVVVIDVTYCGDDPGTADTRLAVSSLGAGPVISRGAGVSAGLTTLAMDAARNAGIAYQIEPALGRTHTEADAVAASGCGAPVCLICVPIRYMHSPNELIDLADLDATARLVVALLGELRDQPMT